MTVGTTKYYEHVTYWVCAILFCTFSYVYLYYYQADLLTVTQTVLSGGKTHYDHLIGAVLISTVLMLVAFLVHGLCKFFSQLPGLAFFPSAVLLALTTSMTWKGVSASFSEGLTASVLSLVLFCVVVVVLQKADIAIRSLFARSTLVHRLLVNVGMVFMWMLLVFAFCNNDRVFHIRLKAERQLSEGQPRQALATLEQVNDPDTNLTMLRAYALSKLGRMGDVLFAKPLAGGSSALLPETGSATDFLICPTPDLYRHLGIPVTRQHLSPKAKLVFMHQRGIGKKPSLDYLLCAYLLDKDLDGFVNCLRQSCAVNDSLPKHYREALLLYTHMRSNPSIVYRNPIMETDYQDYQTVESSSGNAVERKAKLRDTFGNTYWYYYQYGHEKE